MTPKPIYTPENCAVAYQLNWSLTVVAGVAIPTEDVWLPQLQLATERDGVRILEYRAIESDTAQLLVSTRPDVSPASAIRSVKGRWQYILRDQIPKL
jgi:hypothetical protein